MDKCLSELCATHGIINLLIEDVVGVHVKLAQIGADEQKRRVLAGTDIQVSGRAVVHGIESSWRKWLACVLLLAAGLSESPELHATRSGGAMVAYIR